MANNVTLPKRTTIGGMPHKLAYITPQEGDLLKRMGGSGQMHRGIPAYPPAGDRDGAGGGGGSSGGGGGGGGGRERAMEGRQSSPSSPPSGGGGGRERAMEAARQAAERAARERAAQQQRDIERAAAQRAAAEAARQQAAQEAAQLAARQRQQQELAAQAALQQAMAQQAAQQAAAAEAERFARQNRIMQEQAALSRYQPVRDPAGNIVGQITPPSEIPMGLVPLLFSALPFEQRVYSGDPRYDPFDVSNRFDTPDRDGRPQQVALVQDPATGQERCPEGYYFNETLQACIMDTRSTSPFQPSGSMGVAEMSPPTGYYARMGLLDQPPSGLLEAGFGTPQDFAAANTAFRRGAATRPDIYTDPYNLQGYTLLS